MEDGNKNLTEGLLCARNCSDTVYALNVNIYPSLGSGSYCYPHFTDVNGDHRVPWKEQQSWILSSHSPGPIFRRWLSGKEFARHCRRRRFNPWAGKLSWRRAWQPTPVFVPGESHRQRSLAGYSPTSHKESDTTERLSTQKLQAQGLFPSPLVQTASPGTSPRQSRLQERGSRTRGSAAASGFCYIGFPPVEGEGI